MFPIKIQIEGDAIKRLEAIAHKSSDLRPFYRSAAAIIADAVEDVLEKEGRPSWSPLADATIKDRERKGHWPGKMLQVSGQLASSIARGYGSDHAYVGSNKVYAAIHQYGGPAERGRKATIPARPYLVLSEADMNEIEEVGTKHILGDLA